MTIDERMVRYTGRLTPLLGLSWNCPVLENFVPGQSQDKNKNAFFLLNFMNLKQILTGII